MHKEFHVVSLPLRGTVLLFKLDDKRVDTARLEGERLRAALVEVAKGPACEAHFLGRRFITLRLYVLEKHRSAPLPELLKFVARLCKLQIEKREERTQCWRCTPFW